MAVDAGQAADAAPESIDDLAQFLADNPDVDGDQPSPREKEGADDTTREEGDPDADKDEDEGNPAPDDEEPDDEGEADDEGEEEEASGRKYKVTVKAEDGTDVTKEMTLKELKAGVMLQADYSRKLSGFQHEKQTLTNQALGAFESQRQQYVQRLGQYEAALMHFAGAGYNDTQLAALAQSDPAEWVRINQRNQEAQRVLAALRGETEKASRESEEQATAMRRQALGYCWAKLGQAGIDKPKLRRIFDDIAKHYQVTDERFEQISDPALVFILRDAAAFQALKAKTASAARKVKEAPKLPAARQGTPRNQAVAKRINDRFKGGKAKVSDLAAYLTLHKL